MLRHIVANGATLVYECALSILAKIKTKLPCLRFFTSVPLVVVASSSLSALKEAEEEKVHVMTTWFCANSLMSHNHPYDV